MKLTEKLNTLLAEYKAKFGSQEIAFVDAKLNDGVTVVRLPNLPPLKGDAITVITEQGELPLPDNAVDAPYCLEDGTCFTVVNGLVDVVMEVEAPEESAMPEEVSAPAESAPLVEDMGKKDMMPKRVIKSQVEEHIFSVELENEIIEFDFSLVFEKANAEVKSLTEKFNAQLEINSELSKAIDVIGDEPSTTGVEASRLPKKSWEDMTALEKFRASKG